MKSHQLPALVRNASVFNPDSIFVTKKEDLRKNLKLLLQHFVKIKVLTTSHADKASFQYGEFLKNDMKLVNTDDYTDRLDDFFFTKLDVGKKYLELSKFIIIILTLSHGQAEIERGFCQNKTALQQNIKGDSISSKRIIKYHMLANKSQPRSIEITNEVRKSVRAARTRYESLKTESAKKIIGREIKGVWSRITR